MSRFRASTTLPRLGFDGVYLEHARSRWHGTRYWLVANPDAVPVKARELRRAGSPVTIAAAVEPIICAVKQGVARHAEFGTAVKDNVGWRRGIGDAADLAVDAHFLAWIMRHVPSGGKWWLGRHLTSPTQSRDYDQLVYFVGSKPLAVLMPICQRSTRELRSAP